MKTQLTINLQPDDLSTVQALALTERRKPMDVVRNLLEDIVEGRVTLEIPEERKEKVSVTSVRMDAEFKEKLRKFKEDTGLSVDKALHLALAKLRTAQELMDGANGIRCTGVDATSHSLAQPRI